MFSKLIAELRMSDVDQGLRALPNRFAMQVRDAVFRDYVMNVGATGYYTRARRQHRHDARNRIVLSCRGQRDDRLAAFASGRPANEVNLTAKAAEERRPH